MSTPKWKNMDTKVTFKLTKRQYEQLARQSYQFKKCLQSTINTYAKDLVLVSMAEKEKRYSASLSTFIKS